MPKITRRLGRGLDSLVSNLATGMPPQMPGVVVPHTEQVLDSGDALGAVKATMLDVDDLIPNPFQPRSNADGADIASLAQSIRQSGMVQPIAVRAVAGGYEIIAGERRWRAAKSLGMARVPVLVREASEEQMLELALIENIQREDLNAIDRAAAYRQFCNAFGLKAEEVAHRLGEDRSTVANYLRLLDLPDEVQRRVADGKLSMGHARCLLGVDDPMRLMQLAESVISNQLSVRALEEIVRREKTRQGPPPATPRTETRSPHVLDLQNRFEAAVRTKVTLREGKKKGTGRITIEYFSLDDFDRIANLLGVDME